MAVPAKDSVLYLTLKAEKLDVSTDNDNSILAGFMHWAGIGDQNQVLLPSIRISAFHPSGSSLWKMVRLNRANGGSSQHAKHSCEWSPIKMTCNELCRKDLDRPIQLEVVTDGETSDHVNVIGVWETTLRELLKLRNIKHQSANHLMRSGKCVGEIIVVKAIIQYENEEEEDERRARLRQQSQNDSFSDIPSCTETVVSSASSQTQKTTVQRAYQPISFQPISEENQSDSSSESSAPVLTYMAPTEQRLALTLGPLQLHPMLVEEDTKVLYKLSAFRAGNVSPFQVVFTSGSVPVQETRAIWGEASVALEDLCSGHFDWPILISVFSHQPNGRDLLLGSCQTSIRGLQGDERSTADGKMEIKWGLREVGALIVTKATILESLATETEEQLGSQTGVSSLLPTTPQELIAVSTTCAFKTPDPKGLDNVISCEKPARRTPGDQDACTREFGRNKEIPSSEGARLGELIKNLYDVNPPKNWNFSATHDSTGDPMTASPTETIKKGGRRPRDSESSVGKKLEKPQKKAPVSLNVGQPAAKTPKEGLTKTERTTAESHWRN